MYWGSEYRSEDRLPSVSVLYEQGIALSGMSKTYSLPGLRIGWLMSQKQDLIAELQKLKDYTTICPSGPSEFLAETALSIAPKLMQRSVDIIQSNLSLAEVFARRWPDHIGWRAPMAGSVAFARYLPGNIADMALRLVNAEGVLLVPSHTFQFGDDHFRLGLGRRNFEEGLSRFEQFLKV